MAVFFSLRCQGAATRAAAAARDFVCRSLDKRPPEADPVDGRIFARVARVQQLAVFNKQQAFNDNFGDVLKVLINAGGVGRVKQGPSAAVIDFKSGLRLFMIGRVNAVPAELQELRRKARLGLNGIAFFPGALKVARKAGVAAALV